MQVERGQSSSPAHVTKANFVQCLISVLVSNGCKYGFDSLAILVNPVQVFFVNIRLRFQEYSSPLVPFYKFMNGVVGYAIVGTYLDYGKIRLRQ